MRILLGTDGSDDAVAAAVRAISLLAPADIITLVCVVEVPAAATAGLESGFSGGVASPDQVDAAWDEAHSEAGRALDRTAAAIVGLIGDGPTVESRAEHGAPGPELCRLAEDQSADVVAVGSRGRGAIRRALLGSVSTHVVNNAPCAVMVIRSGAD